MRFQTELLLLLCSTLLPSSCALSTEKFDALIEWMSEHPGFESRVRMGENEDGFRGIFVKDDMKEGEVIFNIPVSTALNIGGYDTANSESESYIRILEELKDPTSRYRAYLDTLPAPDELSCICNLPEEYLSLFPEDDYSTWGQHWRATQLAYDMLLPNSKNFTTANQILTLEEALGDLAANITREDLMYACGLSSTRALQGDPRLTHFMLPLFDLSNHKDDCYTNLYGGKLIDRDDGIHGWGMVAGRDMKAGEEVCYGYHTHGRDDDFLFCYGYLPSPKERPSLKQPTDGGPPVYPLLTIDVNMDYVEANNLGEAPLDIPFIGTHVESEKEIERLRRIVKMIEEGYDKRPTPDPVPGFEFQHAQLIELNKRRKLALSHEIQRLQEQLQTE